MTTTLEQTKAQAKIAELSNLIKQYDNGVRDTLNADEYDTWVTITDMLKTAEIDDNIFDSFCANPEQYTITDGVIVYNENWEEEAAEAEATRIANLTMTPLDFINFLVDSGLTLEQINSYLEANLSIKMQLTYCQYVFCGIAKALMPITVGDVTITADMVEDAFIERL